MFEVRVNGKKFSMWETASLTRSIDQNAGTFEFSSSNKTPADFPVKAGDAVQIVINGVTKLTGFADVVRGNISSDEHSVTVAGRDNTCDLIDSSVPDSAKTIDVPTTLPAMCKKIIGAIGLKIAVTTENINDLSFSSDTGITADSGKQCMDFLTSFARKKQAYLVPSGDGGLVIYRPGKVRTTTDLLNKKDTAQNNVKSASVTLSHNERFNKYKATSQANVGFLDDVSSDNISTSDTATDNEIRATRYCEFQADESMDNAECGNRATEEANVRKARSVDYNCSVAGVTWADGTLWDFGQLVKVADDFMGINGIFLIRSVEYATDLRSGTTTSITVCPPDGYNVRMDKEGDTRRAKQSSNLQKTSDKQTQEPAPTPTQNLSRRDIFRGLRQ